MDSLAAVSDLEARLGHPVTDAGQAQAALDDVSAAVRAYTGQMFSRLTTTDRLTARLGLVRLPQRPVNAVDAVELTTGYPVAFSWLVGEETLCVGAAEGNCSRVSSVLVTYDHGYDTVPQDVVAVVCAIANRVLGTDPTSGGVTQRSITNYQESYGPIGGAGASGLFSSEESVLDRYRRVGTVAWIGV